MNDATITTPEHVEIRLEPAGAGSRFLAIMIDSLMTNGLSLSILWVAGTLLPVGIAMAIYVSASFLLTWGWHVYFETRHGGRSPGKRALRLRVVDARGLPISLHQALVRNIMRAIDFVPAFYGFAAISTLVDPRRRRLGDLVADTLVIREARPLAWHGQLAAERRYNSLRTARVLRLIRHRISLEEREFLLALCMRAETMTAEARYDLMEEVAAAYRARLSIDDDEPISGENFVRDLTAVLFAARPAARAA
ncbi:MAG TPA: RDD family protein [Thermoanaerobaculia bacterium]|nr:RDD family protein [Thermoanaerobaculia bacterium]